MRKINFKPTSRKSSHASASAAVSGQRRSIRPGGTGFRHPQAAWQAISNGTVRSTAAAPTVSVLLWVPIIHPRWSAL
jgi:hypothetical protein